MDMKHEAKQWQRMVSVTSAVDNPQFDPIEATPLLGAATIVGIDQHGVQSSSFDDIQHAASHSHFDTLHKIRQSNIANKQALLLISEYDASQTRSTRRR